MIPSTAFDELDAQAASMSADLSSWDFLQDLEFGVDLATDGKVQLQTLKTQPTSTERVREQNRKAQQRARQKKKVDQQPQARSPLSAAVLKPSFLHRNGQQT